MYFKQNEIEIAINAEVDESTEISHPTETEERISDIDTDEVEEFVKVMDSDTDGDHITIPLKDNHDKNDEYNKDIVNVEENKHIELVTIIPSEEDMNKMNKDGDDKKEESSTVHCDYYVDARTNEVLLHSTEKLQVDGEQTDIEDPTEPQEITATRRPRSRCCFSWNICSFTFRSKNKA